MPGDPERIRTADLLRDREACWTATPRGRGCPVYIRLRALIAESRLLLPDHETLDHLCHAALANPPGDVSGGGFQGLGRVAHGDPEAGPRDHVLIVEVVADGTNLRPRDAQPVRNHGQGPRLGDLRVDDLDEPVERSRHPPLVARPDGQLRD